MEQEQTPDFERAELELLKIALKRTYKERFLVMTKLMKRTHMLKNASITHKALPAQKK
ncbi:hypothetical protein CLV51_11120 [Chitinophaga niastensis]|uniref:Uncharacterized protein n=1 Tax=Chitinophaga niastensis TaxID=536980 RepID=A0A2P8H8S6_CHINA|nr:hypothetical protein [Chitinophaga niastensis]PSL42635.1 hypothetical protein CLV51_11120 [Chitinophaga niastensis]